MKGGYLRHGDAASLGVIPGQPVSPRAARTSLATTAQRGYGAAHQRLRRRWTPFVDAGLAFCVRCRRRILPGQLWDLGHDDVDRSKYTGPEHAACNRATAGRARARRVRSQVW